MGELIESNSSSELPVLIPEAQTFRDGNRTFLAIPSVPKSNFEYTCIARNPRPDALNTEHGDEGVIDIPISMYRCKIIDAAKGVSALQRRLLQIAQSTRLWFHDQTANNSMEVDKTLLMDMEPPHFVGPNNQPLNPIRTERNAHLVMGRAPVTEETIHKLFPRFSAERAGNAWLVYQEK